MAWMLIVCVSLLSGTNVAGITEQAIIENTVRNMVNPICGLTAYVEMTQRESFWQQLLREIMSVPIPLISYANSGEGRETSGKVISSEQSGSKQTAVGDPVYERYVASEILYHGTGVGLLSGADVEVETGHCSEAGTEDKSGVEKVDGTVPDKELSGEVGDAGENIGANGGEEVSSGVVVPVTSNRLPTMNGTLYTLNQLKDFDYLVKQLYFVHNSTTVYPSQLKVENLLAKDLTIEKRADTPQILIHHTHGTEGFLDTVDGQGKTILEVGDYLTELLESYGYRVIHDRSIYPYDTAYSEANVRVRQILAQNPSIELVIDLHRDATASRNRYTVELNGETYAPLMFFNGMCQTADGPISYLNNPYLEDNLALSLQMKLLAEAYYPGLTRPNFLKAYQYNQHLMPRYTLVEAGFDTNTFDEVCRSMVPLAKILDAVLSDPDAVKLAGGQ